MARTPFKLRSGNSTPFKQMGSSPAKHPGYGEHVHKQGSPTGKEKKNKKKKNNEIKLDPDKKIGSYDYFGKSSQTEKFAKETPKVETVKIDESKTELVDPEEMIIIADTGEKKSQSSRPEGVGPVTEEPSPDDSKKLKPKGDKKPKKSTKSKKSTTTSKLNLVKGGDWTSLEGLRSMGFKL